MVWNFTLIFIIIFEKFDKNLIIEDENNEENFEKKKLFFDVKLENLYDYFTEQNIPVNLKEKNFCLIQIVSLYGLMLEFFGQSFD